MTEEIKYNKDEKWVSYEQLAETPQQTIDRLEQENKELKEKITSLESEIRQKKMTIMMNNDHYLTVDENNRKYRSALEKIREVLKPYLTECLGSLCEPIDEVLKKIEEALK